MSGEIALITGANRGLGLGLTREFVRLGWCVFAGCRDPARANELVAAAAVAPDRLRIVPLDVRNEADAAGVAALVAESCGRLDVLINNAGINPAPRESGIADVPVEHVAAAVDVNVLGALRLLQATLPLLRRSECARVVNISSGAGSLGRSPTPAPPPAYCLSKAALNMLTRRAARDLAGITVVSVSPGWIRTDMGGPEAELGLEEAVPPLAATIVGLDPSLSGAWIDRFGRPSEYAW